MKYIWPLANTVLLFLMFMYVGITKNINTKALDKCEQLEKELDLQEKRLDYISNFTGNRDTIVVNINYNTNKAKTK